MLQNKGKIKMIKIIFFSMIIQGVLSYFNNRIEFLNNSSLIRKENRMLLSQYCLDYDTIFPSLCIRCQDMLNLPNCNTCPIGYYPLFNQCMQCQRGSLECTNLYSPLYCYQGYFKSGSSCICSPPNMILYDWCTSYTNVFYYSYYRLGGIIVSKFSIEILTTNNINDATMYQFNTNNCNVLSNKAAYTTISSTMACSIDPNSLNLFLINLNNSQVTDMMYQVLPQFSISNLYIKVGQVVQFANSITIQQTSTPNSMYYQLNQVSAPQCGFKVNQYRYTPGSITIPHTDFIVNGFSGAQVTFSIQSTTSTDTVEEASLLAGIQMYPNDMTFTFNSVSFAEANLQQTYVIQFICNLPFGIQSSNTVTIIKIQNYQVSLNVADVFGSYMSSIYSPYEIYTKQEVYTNFFLLTRQDEFYLNVQIFDTSNILVYTYPQITVKGKGLFPLLMRPSPPLSAQQYNIVATLIYKQDSTLAFPTTLPTITVQNPPPLYAIILEGDRYNVNPTLPLTLTMEILPSYSGEPYSWNIFRTSTQDFVFTVSSDQPSYNPLNQPPSYYNCSQIFIIEFNIRSYTDYSYHQYAASYVSTIAPNMQVIFNSDYLQYGLNLLDLLSFTQVYANINLYNRINMQHYFTITYWYNDNYGDTNIQVVTSNIQNVPQFYFTWAQYITNSPVTFFQIIFYANDQNNNQVAFSQTFSFNILPGLNNCQSLQSSAIGGEQGFISPIVLSMTGCSSSYSDGLLYYQFYYYLQSSEISQETLQTTWPANLSRRFLTNFQLSNTITTIFPPGNIIMCVDAKDSHEGLVSSSTQSQIDEPAFTFDQYIAFLQQEEAALDNFDSTQQFEDELSVIGMIIECIIDFEANNLTSPPSVYLTSLKKKLYYRLFILTKVLLSNRLSGDMQEFILRCLTKLLSTRNVYLSDNTEMIFLNFQEFLEQKHFEIQYYGIYEQQQRDTYIRQMTVVINILCSQIPLINRMPTPTDSVGWAELQIDTILLAQSIIALSLNVNQPAVDFTFNEVSLITQRVDTQAMIQNYLLNLAVPLSRGFDERIIFDVMLQYWTKNLYVNDPLFIAITQPYYLTAPNSLIQQELLRVYPAIQPLYISQYDVPVFYRRLRRMRNRVLIIEQQQNLILPTDTTLEYNFNSVEGTGVVVCTQRISDIWSTSSCKSTVSKNPDGTYNVACVCNSPSYTTLVYDTRTLFTNNKNLQADLSAQGVSIIFSNKNWYKYAGVYVILSINVLMVISLVFSFRLDKIQLLLSSQGIAAAAILSIKSNKIQPMNLNTEADDSLLKNTKKEVQNKQNQIERIKKHEQIANSHFYPEGKSKNLISQESEIQSSDDKGRLVSQVTESPGQIIEPSPNLLATQEFNLDPKAQQIQKKDLKIESIEDNEIIKKESTDRQTIGESSNRIFSLNTVRNTEISMNSRRKRQSVQKRQQYAQSKSNALSSSIVFPQHGQKHPKKIKITQSSTNTNEYRDKVQEQIDLTSIEKINGINKKEESLKQLEKSQSFMNSLSLKRGIVVFHILLQIFVVYNKNQSRIFRFSSYYSNIVWTLAINATFGQSITISQVIILSLISISTFGVYSVLLGVLQKWRAGKYVSFFLYFSFILFCYYVTFVAMFSSSPTTANSFILSFCYTIAINTFILQTILAVCKFLFSKKLITSGVKPTNIIYVATTADVIFEQFL